MCYLPNLTEENIVDKIQMAKFLLGIKKWSQKENSK